MANDYLACTIERQTYALPLSQIESVLSAAALCIPPKESSSLDPTLLGLLNYHGQLIAIKDGRKRFGHSEKELEPSDLFILVQAKQDKSSCDCLFGLRVDKVGGVFHLGKEQLDALCPCYGFKGALPDGTLVIDDFTSSFKEQLKDV